MTRYVLFILLMLNGHVSFNQLIKVIDSESKTPIENIYVFDSHNSTLTNKEGNADISNFSRTETIYLQHPSYRNMQINYQLIVEKSYTIELQSSIFPIGEVVISANKWEQNSSEIPLKILRIKEEEIKHSTAQTTADLLKSSKQVYIQKSQLGGGSPMIRGFSANRVLLVLDGIRLNNAIYRSGNLQNVIGIDPNSLESAEVILGPGSIIYGSDAIGGVMDFHTLQPKYSTSEIANINFTYKTRYSSANNEIMNHANYNFGKEKLSFAGSISYSDFGDQKMGNHGPDDYLRNEYVIRKNGLDQIIGNSDAENQVQTGYNQFNTVQKVRYKASSNLELLYGFHYTTSSNIPRYDRLTQYKDENLKYAEWYYGPQKLQLHNLQINSSKKNKFYDSFKINTAYQNYEESRHDRKFGSNSKRNRSEKLDIYSFNVDAEKKITSKTHFFYGSEWTHNKLNSEGYSNDITTKESEEIASRYPNNSKYSSLAFYSNLKWKLNEKWTLNTGIRYSHIWINSQLDNRFYDFPFEKLDLSTGSLNGGIGIAHQSESGWGLKINATSGFRAPNIDDIGKVFDSEPGKVVVPNKNLKPEYIYNFEFNISKNFAQILFTEFNVFYSFLDQAMVRGNYSFNDNNTIIYDGVESEVQAIVNADNAKIWGFNLNTILKINNHFSANGNINLTYGEYKDGSPVRHVPPLFSTLDLKYKSKQLSCKLELEYNGEISYKNLANTEKDKAYIYAKDKNGNPYSPNWLILNWENSYKLNNKLNLNFSVENIFNKRYRPYSSGISAMGRNFVLGFSYSL
nr:TonB-dependent receptor [uncultured Marinifilum sp.]